MVRTVFVAGVPAPQGSKRHVGNGVLVESSKAVKPWRQDVAAAIVAAGWHHDPIVVGPVSVHLEFLMPRPKAHLRANGQVKESAPRLHDKRPDVDKLTRAVLDALAASGAIRDDSQVAHISATKCYSWQPGVRIAMGVAS